LVDTLIIQIITAASMSVGAVLGIMQLRASWLKRTEKSEERIQEWIAKSDDRILNQLSKNAEVTDSRFKVVDNRIAKDEEDIEDVEDDMKLMVEQFRQMCDKLSKHEYVLDDVMPEFKGLKKEFYEFKHAVDHKLDGKNLDISNRRDSPNFTTDRIDDPEHSRS
jgi:hypothetical protein